jgi:xanthine/CO dehydrogenase XdhC/CoxF family maturation factor
MIGERQSLLEVYFANLKAKKPLALATVLRVRGSSYRQPGSRMLITVDGEITGSVSGGCLERELIRQARILFSDTQASRFRVITFDTTEEGDEFESHQSISLGCQGVVDMSLEVIPPGEEHPILEAIHKSVTQNQSSVWGTVIETGQYFPEAQAKATCESAGLLIEEISPPIRFVIFGAGQDAIALSNLSRFMGWHTTVVDCQSAYTCPARFFPHVDHFIKCNPQEIIEKANVTNGSLCVLVTHNYHQDLQILKDLLKCNVGYIGLMGPKTKGQSIIEDLKRENPNVVFSNLAHFHSPAGLDTGARDPNGMALSIISEAMSVLEGREGGFLRNRQAPIHNRKSV